jgi:aminoglycoside 6'-N-acetyltransferase I
MRDELWPGARDEHVLEIAQYFAGHVHMLDQVYMAVTAEDLSIGFIELSIRNYAEGSDYSRVPYVEGWFVAEAYRGQGVGKLLMQSAENWARDLGYSELASDAELDNLGSIAAHKAFGFDETERVVCFLKRF